MADHKNLFRFGVEFDSLPSDYSGDDVTSNKLVNIYEVCPNISAIYYRFSKSSHIIFRTLNGISQVSISIDVFKPGGASLEFHFSSYFPKKEIEVSLSVV